MIDSKEFYRSLQVLVNNKSCMDLLHLYAEHRIETLRGHLETQKDHSRTLEAQGAIMELRRFATLRDEVLKENK